jgi:ABC-2 type transport system ATP-binding protein
MQELLSVDSVSKSYGRKQVLDSVSIKLWPGEIVGLLGPNGAGKSTLIEIITGLRNPESGSVTVNGGSSPRSQRAKRAIGFVPQEPAVHRRLSVFENLHYTGLIYGISKSEIRKRIDYLFFFFDLKEQAKILADALSGGQLRRLNFALADVHDPIIVILDEPTVGLDPKSRRTVWQIIEEFRDHGKAVMLTTHYIEEAEALCDRIVMIDQGKVITEGTPADLKSGLSSDVVIICSFDREITDDEEAELLASPGVINLIREPRAVRILAESGGESTVRIKLESLPYKIVDFRASPATLEDVFLALTGRQIKDNR